MYKLAFVLAVGVQGLVAAVHADNNPLPSFGRDPFEDVQRASDAHAHEQARQMAAKEQQFVESFNRLAAALEEFARSYKVTHSVDAKQAKSIREAYRKLERADPWFKSE